MLNELSQWLSLNAVDITTGVRSCYTYDASNFDFDKPTPDAVLFPLSKEDVATMVKIARKYSVPITPRGAATGLTGGAIPIKGGVVISLERMNRIWAIDPVEKIAIVEPGVRNNELQMRLSKYSLAFPCEPSSAQFSTLGGNLAENACGFTGRLLGQFSAHVAGLIYINDEGEIVKTGYFNNGKNRVAEQLIIGSEGTAGIVVRIALWLMDAVAETTTSMHFFKSGEEAISSAHNLLTSTHPPAAIEYMDSSVLTTVVPPTNPLLLPLPSFALLVEFHQKISPPSFPTAISSITAHTKEERLAIWELRNSVSTKLYNVAPRKINEDIAIPLSKMVEFANEMEEASRKAKFVRFFNFGHLPVGTFHATVMYDPSQNGAKEEADSFVRQMMVKVVDMGGTITSEHGIGLTKKDFITIEFDSTALDFHKKIKQSLDPNELFNPGKIYD